MNTFPKPDLVVELFELIWIQDSRKVDKRVEELVVNKEEMISGQEKTQKDLERKSTQAMKILVEEITRETEETLIKEEEIITEIEEIEAKNTEKEEREVLEEEMMGIGAIDKEVAIEEVTIVEEGITEAGMTGKIEEDRGEILGITESRGNQENRGRPMR